MFGRKTLRFERHKQRQFTQQKKRNFRQVSSQKPVSSKAWFTYACGMPSCDCIIMPLLAAEIPAKLNSSQLSRPTADVTVALEAIGEQMFT